MYLGLENCPIYENKTWKWQGGLQLLGANVAQIFFGVKLWQWHPVFLHLFQVQKPHDAGHALEMFSEQTNPSQVVQLLLFASRKSLSSAQVTGAEGQ